MWNYVLRAATAMTIVSLIAACGESVTQNRNARILAMGDSMLAMNRPGGKSVMGAVERHLNEPVLDRSVSGAQFNYPLPISGAMGLRIGEQYAAGNWDWVILNGGGNDLFFGCGCVSCATMINRLVSADAKRGTVVETVRKIRATGARVIFVGYLHSPGIFSVIDHCKAEDIEYERRIAKLAAADKGVFYIKLSNLVPNGDTSFHSIDAIHPSVKGSAVIGALIAKTIRDAES